MSRRVCPVLIVHPRGIVQETGKLSEASIRRAEAAAAYDKAHPRLVERIICCGMYSLSMPEAPANGATEARGSARILREHDVDPAKIWEEPKSRDSFTSWTELVGQRLLVGTDIGRERPLGVVSGWAQYLRLREIGSQALGLPFGAFRNIRVPGENNPWDVASELVGTALTMLALIDAEPGSIEQTLIGRDRFELWVGGMRGRGGYTGE